MDSNKTERFTKLDGLRGLLSLIVCFNHSFMVLVIPAFATIWNQNIFSFHDTQSKLQQIFMLLGNGGVAVTLFFLLSGFVLGPSLAKIKMDFRGLIGFWIKRLIRLYPVYIFLILLTAIYMKSGFVYQTFPSSSTWFNWWMHFQMTFKEFILNLFFVHTYLGGVTWTLRVILITSFIFPFFYIVNKRTSWKTDLLITVFLIIASFTFLNFGENFRDLRYLYMFYLGLSLPKFKNLFQQIPNKIVVILLPFLTLFLLDFRYLTNQYIGGVGETLVCFFIIGLAAYGKNITVLKFLDDKFLKFFGKISYSLYLIHFSILYILSREMFVHLPNLSYSNEYFLIHLSLFITSTLIAVVISYFVYRFIELPSHKLSIKAGQKIAKE